jgi:hypothetical protein
VTNIDQLTAQLAGAGIQPHPQPVPGPYMVDLSIILASGGRITFTGRDLHRDGLDELFAIVRQALAFHEQ